MKKILSTFLVFAIVFLSVSFSFGIIPSAAALTEDEIAAKNYPLPEGYQVDYAVTFNTSSECSGTQSSDEGTFYNGTSNAVTLSGYWREYSAFSSYIPLTGTGFMFWYKSDNSAVLRMRTNTNGLIMEGTLPACSEGQWVTFYYYGKCINFTFKTDMSADIRSTIANTANTYKLNLISVSGAIVYIDEFITFSPKETVADTYDNDEQAFKFSLKRYSKCSKTVASYHDDGSVTLSSEYGSTANGSPVNIYYNMDAQQFAKAVAIAKQGSGYLQIKVDNISCLNSSDEDAYAKISLTMAGIEKNLIRYSYGSGTSDTYLIKVSDIEDAFAVTTLLVNISGSSIKDVKFKFSPITVFHFPEDEIIIQAEDLNPKHYTSSYVTEEAPTTTTSDGNLTFVYSNKNDQWLSFELPELAVGEYEVYASCNAIKNTDVKVNVSINNLRQLVDVTFTDETYSSQRHYVNIPIGTLKITKNYSDGASELKFSSIQYCSMLLYFDYFSFKKTDTVVEAEPSSNFVVKDYPEMQDYEIKTVLSTYDTYICGSDVRWYKTQQIAGYVGDSNAYNLNSRATIGGGFDNNHIYYNKSKCLDGNGLRFWYKSSATANLRFYNGNMSERFSYKLPANSAGGWYTIYYSDLVEDGDMSSYYSIEMLNGGNSYIDELHTIWEKEGDLLYELNGDGTASVVGYNLRLEDVTVAETYKGCPVVSIKDGALADSLTIKSIVLPDSLTSIGANAFDGCLNLKSVNLEDVDSIGDGAFNNCEKLTDVTLNNNTLNISATAFSECDALYINVTDGSNQKAYAIANSYDYKCETSEGLKYYRDFANSSSTVNIISYNGEKGDVVVPSTIDDSSVVMIDSSAFSGNTVIKTVVLSSSITSVKDKAFNSCTSLVSIDMQGVVTIGEKAFYNCSSLKTATAGDSLVTVGANAFEDCLLLEEFYFSDSITSIGANAFKNSSPVAVMTDATYKAKTGYSYEYVNNNEFKYYPDNDDAFEYYVVNYIASISGYKGSSSTVGIPSAIDGYDVKNVAENAFKDKSFITTVVFNENMRNINDYAFYNCSQLSAVTYPDSLRKITEYAFASCPLLHEVSLTNAVVVAETAFDDTTTVKVVQTNFMRDAFDYVSGMSAGWNLGNTLDAHSHQYSYGDLTVSESEQLWRKWNYISQELFDLVAQKFNTIRIPITWNVFINPDDNYNIDKEFMDRIQEVVDMCYKAGFEYVIINTHHDSDYYFNPNPKYDLEKGKVVIGRVWEQISERFADYDETLIFESMNEIRSFALDWSSADWNGNSELYENYNNLNKIFYQTVRESGGNNAERYLMMQTYGGMRDSKHISSLWLPAKSEDDHIIASIHWYNETITEAYWTGVLNMCKKQWIDNGIPCIIGETGLPTYYDSQGNITVYDDDYREKWGEFAFGLFEQYQIKGIIWEDHGTYSTVSHNSTDGYYWKFPKYVEAIYNTTKKSGSDSSDDSGSETPVNYTVTIDSIEYSVSSGSSFALPDNSATDFVCYYDGTNLYNAGDSITVSSDVDFTSLTVGSIKMQYGVSMRLSDQNGMRYYTDIEVDKIEALKTAGATVELGTMIAPVDLLNGKELNFDNATPYQPGMVSGEYQCIVVKYTSSQYYQNENTFVGSIANIKAANVFRKYNGRGYVKVTVNGVEKTFYAEYEDGNSENNSRSIGYLASRVKADSDYYSSLPAEKKAIVDYYVELYKDVYATDTF